MKLKRIIFIYTVWFVVYSHTLASASDMPMPLVNTDWLADNIEQVHILDVRKENQSFTAKPVFKKDKKTASEYLIKVGGHIPNAKFILYENVRSEQKVEAATIKYMLPGKSKFEALVQGAGINDDKPIIIVSNAENEFDLTMAARVYWQMKYYGQSEVAILDGGTAQWLSEGREFSTSPVASSTSIGNWKAKSEHHELLASSEDVGAAIDKNIQLIDVRPLGQYLGIHKSSKVGKYGHIPTAKSYPTELMTTNSYPVKFSSIAQLQETINALNIKPDVNSITYCNSGHMAAGGWFVMYALLGNENVKLYDGSMHQWAIEKRPVVKMKME